MQSGYTFLSLCDYSTSSKVYGLLAPHKHYSVHDFRNACDCDDTLETACHYLPLRVRAHDIFTDTRAKEP